MKRAWVLAVVLLMACSDSEGGGGSGQSDSASPSASGLEITHLTEGTGANPSAMATVVVHYHGTFPDYNVLPLVLDEI